MKTIYTMFFLMGSWLSISAQSIMSEVESFNYIFRVNNMNPYDVASSNFGVTYQWIDEYAHRFDPNNYKMSSQDEFKRNAYRNAIAKEMNNGTKTVDFNKLFYFMSKIRLGEYNFEESCFPMETREMLNNIPFLLYDNSFGYINFQIGNLFNLDDFDFRLKINPQAAESFINSRKSPSGGVNRSVNLKVIYNVVDKKINGDYDHDYIGVYIHRIEIYDGQVLLNAIYPRVNYFDKVNLVRMKNGTEKIFFDNQWQKLNPKDSNIASYYRIIHYKDGKFDSAVIDYFMNGTKQMIGFYNDYGDIMNGPFTWYFENGQISEQVTYVDGLREGKYNAWYQNGQLKEDVNYVADKKEGCDYLWDESGKCSDVWGHSFAHLYKNGEDQVYSSYDEPCKCVPIIKSQISNSSEAKNNPVNVTSSKKEHVGFYNDISDVYKTFGWLVNYSGNIAYISYFENNNESQPPDYRELLLKVTPGTDFSLLLTINDFNRVDNKYTFKYSVCGRDENGEILKKIDDISGSAIDNKFNFHLEYQIPLLPNGVDFKIMYIDFKIQDINSAASIKGFVKLKIIR